jgi:hypothetical protein
VQCRPQPSTGGVVDAIFPVQLGGQPYSPAGPVDAVFSLSGTSTEGFRGLDNFFPDVAWFGGSVGSRIQGYVADRFGTANAAMSFTRSPTSFIISNFGGYASLLPLAAPLSVGAWVRCAPGAAPGTVIEWFGPSAAQQRVSLQAASIERPAASAFECSSCVSTYKSGLTAVQTVAVGPTGLIYAVTDCSVFVGSRAGAWARLSGGSFCSQTTDGPGVSARFWNPRGVVVNAVSGDVIVVELKTIRRITSLGQTSTVAGGQFASAAFLDGVGGAARFTTGRAIATARGGNYSVYYVVDADYIRTLQFAAGGAGVPTVTLLTGSSLATSTGVAAGYANGPIASATFRAPTGLAVDSTGENIYVADRGNNAIRHINLTEGTVRTLAGSLGTAGAAGTAGATNGVGTSATFNGPTSLDFDANFTTLYVAEVGNYIRAIRLSDAAVSTVAGTGAAGSADSCVTGGTFADAVGIAVDHTSAKPLVYVAAANGFGSNGGVRVVEPPAACPVAAPVCDNKWHHAALTYDASSVARVYVDGVLAATSPATAPAALPIPSLSRLVLGASYNVRLESSNTASAEQAPFEGRLADVRVFARELLADEVVGLASFNPPFYGFAAVNPPFVANASNYTWTCPSNSSGGPFVLQRAADNSWTSSGSLQDCAPCGAGTFANVSVSGNTICSNCPAGTFSTAVGAMGVGACAACPANSRSAPGATSCVACGAGTTAAAGAAACAAFAPCPANSYRADVNSSACTLCPAGSDTAGATGRTLASACVPCAAQRYSAAPGASCVAACTAVPGVVVVAGQANPCLYVANAQLSESLRIGTAAAAAGLYVGGANPASFYALNETAFVSLSTLSLGASTSAAALATPLDAAANVAYAVAAGASAPLVVAVDVAAPTALVLKGAVLALAAATESAPSGAVLDAPRGLLYVSGQTAAAPVTGTIVQVNVAGVAAGAAMVRAGSVTLSPAVTGLPTPVGALARAPSLDAANEFAYFVSAAGGAAAPAVVVRVALAAAAAGFTGAAVAVLPLAASDGAPAASALDAHFLYILSTADPAALVRVALANFTRVGAIASLRDALGVSDGAGASLGFGPAPWTYLVAGLGGSAVTPRSVFINTTDFTRAGAAPFLAPPAMSVGAIVAGVTSGGLPVIFAPLSSAGSPTQFVVAAGAPCAAGSAPFASPTAATGLCAACAAGSYAGDGFASCVACAAGSFAALPGAASCAACGDGYTSLAGATNCSLVAPGTFSVAGAVSPCSANSFSSAAGATACTACPAGAASPAGSPSSASCGACGAGAVPTSAGVCAPCAVGFFAVEGAQTCDRCPVGTQALAPGSSGCVAPVARTLPSAAAAAAAPPSAAAAATLFELTASRIFVANPLSGDVTVFNPDDSVAVLSGLGQPVGLAANADGSVLYVADASSSSLLAVSVATGAATAVATSLAAAGGALAAVCAETSENATVAVYVLDSSAAGSRVLRLDPGNATPTAPTAPSVLATGGVGTAADLLGSLPRALAVDAAQAAVFVGTATGTIVSVPSSGTDAVTLFYDSLTGAAVTALAVDSSARLLYAALETGAVHAVTLDSGRLALAANAPAGVAIAGLSVDSGTGQAVVASGGNVTAAFLCANTTGGFLQPSCGVAAPCAPGSVASASGVCSPCAAGSYADATASACLACPVGTYSAGVGATSAASCTACPAGSSTAGVWGSTSSAACMLCAPGRAGGFCTQCAAGSVAPFAGASACSPCAAGLVALSSGLTSCAVCPVGSAPAAGGAACVACPRTNRAGASNQLGLSSCGDADTGSINFMTPPTLTVPLGDDGAGAAAGFSYFASANGVISGYPRPKLWRSPTSGFASLTEFVSLPSAVGQAITAGCIDVQTGSPVAYIGTASGSAPVSITRVPLSIISASTWSSTFGTVTPANTVVNIAESTSSITSALPAPGTGLVLFTANTTVFGLFSSNVTRANVSLVLPGFAGVGAAAVSGNVAFFAASGKNPQLVAVQLPTLTVSASLPLLDVPGDVTAIRVVRSSGGAAGMLLLQTNSCPSVVVAVDIDSFAATGNLTLSTCGAFPIAGSALVDAAGLAYFASPPVNRSTALAAAGSLTAIVSVNASSMTQVETYPLDTGSLAPQSISLEAETGAVLVPYSAYSGSSLTSYFSAQTLARPRGAVTLSRETMAAPPPATLSAAALSGNRASVTDPVTLTTYAVLEPSGLVGDTRVSIARFKQELGRPVYQSPLMLPAEVRSLRSAACDIDSINALLYCATSHSSGDNYVVVINASPNDFSVAALVNVGATGGAGTVLLDSLGGVLYLAPAASDGSFIRISTVPGAGWPQLEPVLNPSSPGICTSGVVDSAGQFAYFGMRTNFGLIQVNLTASPPTAAYILSNNAGADPTQLMTVQALTSAAFDAASGRAFFGSSTSPVVAAVSVADPTRVAVLANIPVTGGNPVTAAAVSTGGVVVFSTMSATLGTPSLVAVDVQALTVSSVTPIAGAALWQMPAALVADLSTPSGSSVFAVLGFTGTPQSSTVTGFVQALAVDVASCVPGSAVSRLASGETTCSRCEEGTYSTAGLCMPCPAGSSSSAGATSCSLCSVGFFASAMGSRACSPCPPGSQGTAAGATSCSLCAPGTVQPSFGSSTCLSCAQGSFAATSGLAACSTCPVNTFQALTGQSSCSACAATSTTGGRTGALSCTTCLAVGSNGTLNSAKTGCLRCPPGTYLSNAGSTTCVACAAGTAQPLEGQSACLACPSGFVSTSTRARNCTIAPAGFFAPTASSIVRCVAGTFSSEGAAACTNCPLGTGSTFGTGTFGNSSCIPALPGSFALSGVINPCGAGTYSANSSATVCTNCAPGSYQPATGQTSCILAAPGSSSSDGVTQSVCAQGRYSEGGVSICPVCPPGTFSPSNASACTQCPANTFSNVAANICTACAGLTISLPGTPANPGCAAAATSCNSGTSYLSSGFCLPCPANGTCVGTRAEVACAQGTFSRKIGFFTTCEACPPGKACAGGINATAQNCSFAPAAAGAAACPPEVFTCSAGSYLSSGACLPCPPSSVCPGGNVSFTLCDIVDGLVPDTVNMECTLAASFCSAGDYLTPSSTCASCPLGFYCPGYILPPQLCPPLYTTAGSGASLESDCSVSSCEPGFGVNASGVCDACGIGTFSAASASTAPCARCPFNGLTAATGASAVSQCLPGSTAGSQQWLDLGVIGAPPLTPPTQVPDVTACAAACASLAPCVAWQVPGASTNCSLFGDVNLTTTVFFNATVGFFPARITSSPTVAFFEALANATAAVTSCVPGFVLSGGACYPCNTTAGVTSGGFACSGGAARPALCPTGTAPFANGTACGTACAAGFFQASDGAACAPCAAGTFMPAGSIFPAACSGCASGSYSNASAATCARCPPGWTSAAGGAGIAACTPCPNGFYDFGSVNVCVACNTSAASGMNVQASTTSGCASTTPSACCTACAVGTAVFDARPGAGCSACPAGTYMPLGVGRLAPCYATPPGTYAGSNAGQPTACPVGTSSPVGSTSAAECFTCGNGTIPASASVNLTLFPGVMAPTSTQCSTCAAGRFALAGATLCSSCAAGFFSNAGAAECSRCPAGTWNGQSSQTQCVNLCGPGTFARAGSSSCASCSPGSFSNMSGLGACFACPVGTFATNTGAMGCSACPPGSVAASSGSASCSTCASVNGTGFFTPAGAGSAACTQCPLGRVSTDGGVTCDSFCPSGFTGVNCAVPCAYSYSTPTGAPYCLVAVDPSSTLVGGSSSPNFPAATSAGSPIAAAAAQLPLDAARGAAQLLIFASSSNRGAISMNMTGFNVTTATDLSVDLANVVGVSQLGQIVSAHVTPDGSSAYAGASGSGTSVNAVILRTPLGDAGAGPLVFTPASSCVLGYYDDAPRGLALGPGGSLFVGGALRLSPATTGTLSVVNTSTMTKVAGLVLNATSTGLPRDLGPVIAAASDSASGFAYFLAMTTGGTAPQWPVVLRLDLAAAEANVGNLSAALAYVRVPAASLPVHPNGIAVKATSLLLAQTPAGKFIYVGTDVGDSVAASQTPWPALIRINTTDGSLSNATLRPPADAFVGTSDGNVITMALMPAGSSGAAAINQGAAVLVVACSLATVFVDAVALTRIGAISVGPTPNMPLTALALDDSFLYGVGVTGATARYDLSAPLCAPGTFSSNVWGGCTACATGSFSAAGALGCLSCPSSSFAVEGSAQCSVCPAGTFKANNYIGSGGPSSCMPCSPGSYSPPNSTACLQCPPNTFASGSGQANACSPCPAGTLAPSVVGATSAVFCSTPAPAGAIVPSGGALRLCAPGTSSAETGAAACAVSPRGMTTLEFGATATADAPSRQVLAGADFLALGPPGAVAFDAASGTTFVSVPSAGTVMAVAAAARAPFANVTAVGLVRPGGISAGSGGALFVADNATGSVWLAFVPALAPAVTSAPAAAIFTAVSSSGTPYTPNLAPAATAALPAPQIIAANFSLAVAGVDAGVVAVAVWPLSSAATKNVSSSVTAAAAASIVYILDSATAGTRVLQLNGTADPFGSVAPSVLATLDTGSVPAVSMVVTPRGDLVIVALANGTVCSVTTADAARASQGPPAAVGSVALWADFSPAGSPVASLTVDAGAGTAGSVLTVLGSGATFVYDIAAVAAQATMPMTSAFYAPANVSLAGMSVDPVSGQIVVSDTQGLGVLIGSPCFGLGGGFLQPCAVDPCPTGSVSGTDGSCVPCAPGTFANASGLTACSPCAAGTFEPDAGQSVCSQTCPAGTYSRAGGASNASCVLCPPGSFSAPGQAKCDLCAPGSSASMPGSVSCSACPVGTASSTVGAAICDACGGSAVAGPYAGATTCRTCPASGPVSTTLCGNWYAPNFQITVLSADVRGNGLVYGGSSTGTVYSLSMASGGEVGGASMPSAVVAANSQPSPAATSSVFDASRGVLLVGTECAVLTPGAACVGSVAAYDVDAWVPLGFSSFNGSVAAESGSVATALLDVGAGVAFFTANATVAAFNLSTRAREAAAVVPGVVTGITSGALDATNGVLYYSSGAPPTVVALNSTTLTVLSSATLPAAARPIVTTVLDATRQLLLLHDNGCPSAVWQVDLATMALVGNRTLNATQCGALTVQGQVLRNGSTAVLGAVKGSTTGAWLIALNSATLAPIAAQNLALNNFASYAKGALELDVAGGIGFTSMRNGGFQDNLLPVQLPGFAAPPPLPRQAACSTPGSITYNVSADGPPLPCIPCRPGTYLSGSSCVACAAGTFSVLVGATSASACLSCPLGTVAPASGSTGCVPCAAGSATATPVTGNSACRVCVAGTFSAQTGAASCTTCPSGSGAASPNSTACRTCAAGFRSSNGVCVACAAGSFAAPGSSFCSSCSTGTFSAAAAGSCTACPAGTYAQNFNSLSCSPCWPGSVSAPGSSTCVGPAYTCFAGSFLAADGACWPCPSGGACAGGATAPVNCTDLGGVPDASKTFCVTNAVTCAAGTYVSAGGCRPCPANSFCPGGNSTVVPTACPTGTGTQLFGANSSSLCVSPVCPSGYGIPVGGTACAICPLGTSSAGGARASCLPCFPGSFGYASWPSQTGLGASSCTLCSSGRFAARFGNGVNGCDECPSGTYGMYQGLSACTLCPANTFFAGTGTSWSGSCQNCPANSFALPGSAACDVAATTCVVGKYLVPLTTNPSISLCAACPSGAACPGGVTNYTACDLLTTMVNDERSQCVSGSNTTCSPGAALKVGFCPVCPVGTVCPGGTDASISCPAGLTTRAPGASNLADCSAACPVAYTSLTPPSTTCAPCSIGSFSTNVNGGAWDPRCYACPANSASTHISGGHVTCDCNAGFYSVNPWQPSFSCAACPTGQTTSAAGATSASSCFVPATTCPAGRYLSAGQCSPCPPNNYCLGGATTYPFSCPSGTVSGTFSQSSAACTPCSAGTYYSFSMSSCDNCPAGSFCPGGTTVTSCGSGFISPAGSRSQGDCIAQQTAADCVPGQIFRPSLSLCESCALTIGLICPTAGTTTGSYCDAVFGQTPNAARTACECAPNQYSLTPNGQCNTCSTCNNYASPCTASADAVCLVCAAGSYAQGGVCATCSAGTWSVAGMSSCVSCAAGTYSSATNATSVATCTQCPVNTFSTAVAAGNASSCTACGGSTVSAPGSTSCAVVVSSCPVGKYLQAPPGVCISCPARSDIVCPGGTSTNYTVCAAGTGPNGNSTQCVATGPDTSCSPGAFLRNGYCSDCAVGSICAGGASAPVACPAGLTTQAAGATVSSNCSVYCPTAFTSRTPPAITCNACPAGKFTTNPSGGAWGPACVTCPANTIAGSGGGSSACTCSPGYFATNAWQPSFACAACPPGSSCASSNSTPVQCSNGTFAAALATSCTSCPAGFYSGASAASCAPCPAGRTSLPGAPSASACFAPVSACAAGRYYLGGVCTPCPANSFCPGGSGAAATAISCPPGRVSPANSTSSAACVIPRTAANCVPGQIFRPSSRLCESCNLTNNMVCPTAGTTNGTFCAGAQAPNMGATACECPNNFYADSSSASRCGKCLTCSSYASRCTKTLNAVCLSCAPGTYARGDACEPCEKDCTCAGGLAQPTCENYIEVTVVYRISASAGVCSADKAISKLLDPNSRVTPKMRRRFARALGFNTTQAFLVAVKACSGRFLPVPRSHPVNDPFNEADIDSDDDVNGGRFLLQTLPVGIRSGRGLRRLQGSAALNGTNGTDEYLDMLNLTLDGSSVTVELGVALPVSVARPLASYMTLVMNSAPAADISAAAASLAVAISSASSSLILSPAFRFALDPILPDFADAFNLTNATGLSSTVLVTRTLGLPTPPSVDVPAGVPLVILAVLALIPLCCICVCLARRCKTVKREAEAKDEPSMLTMTMRTTTASKTPTDAVDSIQLELPTVVSETEEASGEVADGVATAGETPENVSERKMHLLFGTNPDAADDAADNAADDAALPPSQFASLHSQADVGDSDGNNAPPDAAPRRTPAGWATRDAAEDDA